MITDQDLVDSVREYAIVNCDSEGWDEISRWEDWEILAVVKGSKKESQTIRKVKKQVRVLSDHRSEIQAEVF